MSAQSNLSLADFWDKIIQIGVYVIAFFLALGVRDLKKSFDSIPRLLAVVEQLREDTKDQEERLRKLEQKQ